MLYVFMYTSSRHHVLKIDVNEDEEVCVCERENRIPCVLDAAAVVPSVGSKASLVNGTKVFLRHNFFWLGAKYLSINHISHVKNPPHE